MFPFTRWENLSTLLLPSGLSLSPPADKSFLNASFYLVSSSFWNLVSFSLPARPVYALDVLNLIKFCSFLSPFRMSLTNPGVALGQSCLQSIILKLLTLSGIPPFSTNLFRLASLLALLVGLNLSFLTGALVWFIKSRSFRVRRGVPQGSVLGPVFFSFFIDDFPASLPSSVSCSLYADDLAIWSSFPSVPTAVEATQGALFRLERWSEYWCLPLNPSKCEASLFSVDPHQAHLQPNLLLLGSRLRFNPTSTFVGVTFDRTLSFSKHVSSLKATFFPRLKALRCICASSWGPSKEFSLLYKSFLRPVLIYASPRWFPFLSATNFIKMECLHRAANRAITGCLSSSLIPLLLTEASLPPLRVTFAHFTLLSYERALRLPISFPFSGLARLGVKPRLCRSSWKAFTSTHPLMLPFTSSREALLACPPFPPWNLPSFTVESNLFSSCCCSDPLTLAKVLLSPTLTLCPLMIWYSGQTALFLFLLARAAPAFLPTALSVALRPLFPFRRAQYAQVFPLKLAPFCKLFAHLSSTNKYAISLLVSSYLTLVLSSPPSFLLSQAP